jgi:hypothetical protein
MYYRHYASTRLWRYRGSSWTLLQSNSSGNVQCCGAIEFFPELGRLIWVDGDWGVWSFDPAGGGWTQIANTNGPGPTGLPQLPMSAYNNFAVYNSASRVVLFGGGSNIYRINSSGAITTTLRQPPVGLGVTRSVIASDPVSGKTLVLAGSSMYQYDIETDTWAQLPTSVPTVLRALDGFGDGLVQVPIREHGVIMFFKYNYLNSKVYLYKHSPFTPATPRAPTALSAL